MFRELHLDYCADIVARLSSLGPDSYQFLDDAGTLIGDIVHRVVDYLGTLKKADNKTWYCMWMPHDSSGEIFFGRSFISTALNLADMFWKFSTAWIHETWGSQIEGS